ncbi:MAG TPA: acetamidase/formamidase family protein [Bryobacterales bacterium]|nr:acetamidase/formamidase family protein [Bryobacterales bacterium]
MLIRFFFCAACFLAALRAETRQVIATQYYHTFSRANPVLARLRPGDTVITKTVDSAGFDYQGIRRTKTHGNPLTGAFYIEGAEPGDALAVHIRKLRLNRATGYSSYRLGLAALAPESVEGLYPSRYKEDVVLKGRADLVPWTIDLERHTVRPKDPIGGRVALEFPARPMLGCIGVAPAGEFTPTSGPAGAWGGNLDYNEVREGATILLPVYNPGGLLFLGDGHALQGDGEPIGSGVETSLDVEFTVDLRKKAGVSQPRIENDEFLISIGSQPEFSSSLDRAVQMATSDMVRWLAGDYGLDAPAAHLLIGMQARYDIITVAGSAALKIPRRALPK